MAEHTALPWCIPDGAGNEHLICAGDDPANPGRILLVLQGARGTRDNLSYEDIAECNRRIVTAVNTEPAVDDLVKVVESSLRILERDFPNGQLVIDARSALSRFRELGGE